MYTNSENKRDYPYFNTKNIKLGSGKVIDIEKLFDFTYDIYRKMYAYNEKTHKIDDNYTLTNYQYNNRYIEERKEFIDSLEKQNKFDLLDENGNVSGSKLLDFSTNEYYNWMLLSDKTPKITKEQALSNISNYNTSLKDVNVQDVANARDTVIRQTSSRMSPQIEADIANMNLPKINPHQEINQNNPAKEPTVPPIPEFLQKNVPSNGVNPEEMQIQYTPMYKGQLGRSPSVQRINYDNNPSVLMEDDVRTYSNRQEHSSTSSRNAHSRSRNNAQNRSNSRNIIGGYRKPTNTKQRYFGNIRKKVATSLAIGALGIATAFTGVNVRRTQVRNDVIVENYDLNQSSPSASHSGIKKNDTTLITHSLIFGGTGVLPSNAFANPTGVTGQILDLYSNKGTDGLRDYLDSELSSNKLLSKDELETVRVYDQVYFLATLQDDLLHSDKVENYIVSKDFFSKKIDPADVKFANYYKNNDPENSTKYRFAVYNNYGEVIYSDDCTKDYDTYIADVTEFMRASTNNFQYIDDTSLDGVQNKIDMQQQLKDLYSYQKQFNEVQISKHNNKSKDEVKEGTTKLKALKKAFNQNQKNFFIIGEENNQKIDTKNVSKER